MEIEHSSDTRPSTLPTQELTNSLKREPPNFLKREPPNSLKQDDKLEISDEVLEIGTPNNFVTSVAQSILNKQLECKTSVEPEPHITTDIENISVVTEQDDVNNLVPREYETGMSRNFTPATHMYNKMNVGSRLGYGTYGDVYHGIYEGKTYAVKRNFREPGTISFCSSLKEMDILGKLNGHPYIIELSEITLKSPYIESEEPAPKSDYKLESYETDPIRFIFEPAKYDLYRIFMTKTPDYSILKKIMCQILLAMEFIHGKGFIHRDIKPSNILIVEYGDEGKTKEIVAKICDFGMAKPQDSISPQTPRLITSWYRPMEIICGSRSYGNKVDIWSTGQVFLEIIRKQALLYGTDDTSIDLANAIWRRHPEKPTPDLIARMNRNNKNIAINKKTAYRERASWKQQLNLSNSDIDNFNKSEGGTITEFIELLEGMNKIDPNQRLSATQCLTLNFFDEFRGLIKKTRNNFPPYPEPIIKSSIYICRERMRMGYVLGEIFNNRDLFTNWYQHRIVFLALDLFDRYISWRINNLKCTDEAILSTKQTEYPIIGDVYKFYPVKTKLTHETKQGQLISSTEYGNNIFHDDEEADLVALVCIYIAIKYFSYHRRPGPFSTLANDKYKTPEKIKEVQQLEILILNEVCGFNIYRPLPIDVAVRYDIKLNEEKIRDLFEFYSLKFYSNMKLFRDNIIKERITLNKNQIKLSNDEILVDLNALYSINLLKVDKSAEDIFVRYHNKSMNKPTFTGTLSPLIDHSRMNIAQRSFEQSSNLAVSPAFKINKRYIPSTHSQREAQKTPETIPNLETGKDPKQVIPKESDNLTPETLSTLSTMNTENTQIELEGKIDEEECSVQSPRAKLVPELDFKSLFAVFAPISAVKLTTFKTLPKMALPPSLASPNSVLNIKGTILSNKQTSTSTSKQENFIVVEIPDQTQKSHFEMIRPGFTSENEVCRPKFSRK